MIRTALSVLVLASCLALPARAREEATPGDSIGTDWENAPEYRIVPGDLLRLNFGPSGMATGMDLVREVRVRPDGRVQVFPVGDVVVAGHTPNELQQTLVKLLSGELKQPRVAVEIAELAGNQIHVLGRVMKPGSVPVGPFCTLLQVLSDAGGFTDDASAANVVVMHRDGARTVRVMRVDANRLMRGGGDVPLGRFDIVYVPRSAIGSFDIFCRQFFGEPASVLNMSMLGWELFNLDRVFVVRASTIK